MEEIKFKYIFDGGECGIEEQIFTLDQIENNEVENYLDCCFVSSAKTIAKKQYTGLKDKNGVEIYNGDKIKITYGDKNSNIYKEKEYITDIFFNKSAFRYKHKDGSGSVLFFNTVKIEEGYEKITQDVEVIENNYETN